MVSFSFALLIGLTAINVGQSFVPSSYKSEGKNIGIMNKRIRTGIIHDRKTVAFSSQQHYEPTTVAASLSSNYFDFLDDWYTQSYSIKCPFFRRRAADFIDGLAMVGRFLHVRHKSLYPDEYTPPGCRAISEKKVYLCQQDLLETIKNDWRPSTGKGYYITGRLNTTVYTNDCFFSGPDPDMPVRGLRKYLGAAAHLFDSRKSSAELLDIQLSDENTILVKWKLQGVLMLPWRPVVPPWIGTTRYHFNKEGLVYHHEESWDKSVLEAFVTTVSPELGERIWKHVDESTLGETT